MQWHAERVQHVDPANLKRALATMLGFGRYLNESGLEPSLLDLVAMRGSQINGCAACLDMHFKEALARGESGLRLVSLDAWRECPYYTDRERAALAWTEAVTLVAADRVPDAVHEAVRPHFSDDELVALTMAATAINAFNRLNVALRTVPGTYEVSTQPHEERVAALVS